MKKYNIADIIDFIFVNILAFLMFFVWVKFFNRNLLISLLISLTLLIIFNVLRSLLKNKKNNKKQISKNLEEDIEQYFLTLLSYSQTETQNFFVNVFKDKNCKLDKKNNVIYVDNNAIIPYFETQDLILDNALKQIKNITNYNIIFLCVNCNPKTKAFLEKLKNYKIKVYEKHDIYFNYFQPNNYYPEILFTYNKSNKFKIKELINISFNKKRAKGYFLSGILIFFASFIVRHNLYYVIMSSILFLFALVCQIKKAETPKKELL